MLLRPFSSVKTRGDGTFYLNLSEKWSGPLGDYIHTNCHSLGHPSLEVGIHFLLLICCQVFQECTLFLTFSEKLITHLGARSSWIINHRICLQFQKKLYQSITTTLRSHEHVHLCPTVSKNTKIVIKM